VPAELVETLERAGYGRDIKELKPFQLQRAVDLGDGGAPALVLVDLLVPREAKTRRNRPALIAGLRVQGTDAAEIALKNNGRLSVDGQMPDGRPNRVEVLVASIPALLVMKGFALDGRDKPKDAYDIYLMGPRVGASCCIGGILWPQLLVSMGAACKIPGQRSTPVRTRTCRDSQQAYCRTAHPVRWRRRGRRGYGHASRTNVWACRLWCFCDSPFSARPLRRF
jgi:hypothetical protein